MAALAGASGCALELDYGPPLDGAGDTGDSGIHAVDVGAITDTNALDGGSDASNDAFLADAPDIGAVECTTSSDCTSARGAPPCGAWQCSAFTCGVLCANCVDNDLDGYGVGSGCAGLDCDDNDPTVTATSMRGCYPFSPSTSGVGTCRGGTEMCNAGAWGACVGAQGPTPESCNGIDDNCDGAIDDGFGTTACGLGACRVTPSVCTSGRLAACVPLLAPTTIDGCGGGDQDCDGQIDEDCTNCVWVSTSGSDSSLDPRVVSTPYATVQHAINFAAMDATFGLRVCLLSNGCSSSIAVFSGPVTMASGVHVAGNYAPGGLSQCLNGWHTEIRTGDATGVLFDGTITRHTQLADVMITPAGTSTSAGVTVSAAHAGVITNVFIQPGIANVINAYGVDVRDGGDVLISGSTIYAGHGSNEGIGVRVVGAHAVLSNNCGAALDSGGRCTMGCPGSTSAGIRGRPDINGARATTSYAILLRDAPGSLVASSATCGEVGFESAGIRIDGDATGTVLRGNYVAGWGGQTASYGVDIASCNGAAPLLIDNGEIYASTPQSPPAPAIAIRSVGDCHPIIQNNLRILSGIEGTQLATGILCGAVPGGISSGCVIEGNLLIHATISGNQIVATGVSCAQDGCARIERNEISGTQGGTLVGLSLGTAPAFVARNHISGGCASVSATGVVAVNSRARFEDNVVVGAGICATAGSIARAGRFVGLAASSTDATYAIDVHGNDFDPGAGMIVVSGGSCMSRGIELTGHAGVDVGVLRGNIVLAGVCGSAYPIYEVDTTSDPIALEHNDLVARSGLAVYRDEGTTDIATAPLVNALGDTLITANIDTPAGFLMYPADLHLAPASMCIDQDTSAGAPSVDFDGRLRSAPDIGAYER